MPPPNPSWSSLFQNIGKQGDMYSNPLSPSNQYYGFLSSCDQDEATLLYYPMFEVVPMEWMNNVYLKNPTVSSDPPVAPASCYQIADIAESTLLQALGLKSEDQLAEGSWYFLRLEKGTGTVSGDLYDPDIDMQPDNQYTARRAEIMSGTNMDYGEYQLTGAQLLTLPQWTSGRVVSVNVTSEADDPEPADGPRRVGMKRSFSQMANNGFLPNRAKRVRLLPVLPVAPPPLPPLPPVLPPPPPPPPPIASIGVMNVGAGGCQLLFDQNQQPVTYFDLGFPLNMFRRSCPANLRFGAVAPSGPIRQNLAGNLEVVLSHWDWDHWRLAHVWGLNNLPWTYVPQPVGPAAANFILTLAARAIYGGAAIAAGANYTLYQCMPAPGAPPAVVMNNSGLAMQVATLLPIADPLAHNFLMTGDANFDALPIHPVFPNLTGITAAHHGSNANGAAANLPNPAAPYALAGRIAYSYGVVQRVAGWIHCYGFPVPAAVLAYIAAGWGTVAVPILHGSTAEGAVLNGALPPGGAGNIPGNIRVGDQTVLPAGYNNTAFFAYPNPLT